VPVGRLLAIALPLAIVALAGWIGYGYLQFRDSVERANRRVSAATRRQLTPASGPPLRRATTVLVLGSDRRPGEGPGTSRSDSIMLVRSDPSRGRMVELSIPRDLRVDIPGHGQDKINAAYSLGGPPLAIRTVRRLLGPDVPINHVALVGFAGFRKLVDALGGVTVDNPRKIVSNSFDGHRWRFGKGRIHLDGRHALAYARVRDNTLDPSDSDVSRGGRQQRVLSGIARELVSPSTLLRLPSVGRAIAEPLATDLTAAELLGLGWRKFRASHTVHCRLGGAPETIGGGSYLIGAEENRQVVGMFLGRSAPLAPRRGDPFAPGCTVE
jgi:LCP family protein required for cell wall assembly